MGWISFASVLAVGLLTALVFPLALPAQAQVMVVGDGLAHDCFVAAKIGGRLQAETGISICSTALEQEALQPHDRAATYVNRGVLRMAIYKVQDAIDDYNTAIRALPDLGDAYVNRGSALITLKQYDQALADINKGIGLGVSYPFLGYFDRAVVEDRMGQFKAAYLDYKQTLTLEPNFAPASERLKDFTLILKDGTTQNGG